MRSRSGHLWRVSVVLLLGSAVSYPLASQVDAICTINGPGNARVCLGDGSGDFSCSNIGQDTCAIGALGDVDNDGNLDAAFAGLSLLVCLGDGEGGFSCVDRGGTFSGPIDVALGFVAGDLHLDVVVAAVGGPIMGATTGSGGPARDQVCLGDGGGGFSCSEFGIAAYSQGAALGFVDNDAFLEAVFARQPPEVCLGDGGGGFSCSGIGMVGSAREVALGNVNSDANLDAIFARPGPSNIVCLGDGNGGFSCFDVNLWRVAG